MGHKDVAQGRTPYFEQFFTIFHGQASWCKKEAPREDLEGCGEDFGGVWVGFWKAFGRGSEPLGAPWADVWVFV